MKIDAQQAIKALIERGFTPAQAYGIAANFQAESGFDAGINEIAPVVPGSRGGFGLYQLTGPRRKQYEAWAQQSGRDLADPNAQLDFMMMELGTTEARAGKLLKEAQTPEEAARVFSKAFLRPGHDNTDYRVSLASKYAGGDFGPAVANVATSATGDTQERNALLAALGALQEAPQEQPMPAVMQQPQAAPPPMLQAAMMPQQQAAPQRDYATELAAFSAQLPWMQYRGRI